MTQPVDIEALRQLLERATAGPWAYRPQEHDDWGFIRTTRATEDGWHPVVAIARDVSDHEDHDAHRASKTDPAEGNAGLIVAAVNALPSLLTELEALRAERGRMVEAKNVILARCEALEDEASAGIDTVIANDRDKTHEGGFWRGQKSTAKSIRCHLHDLTRSTLKEPSQ